jgi:tripartite-type tricarboxylate transporter receptor subunit TctC
MRFLKPLLSAFAFTAIAFSAQAQTFPSKPITLLVGFAPGGGVDIVARALAAQLQEQIGQSVVIENRPGAGSNIAAVAAARAAPDGYTLLVGANGMTTNMKLYANAGFDVQKEFAGVSTIGSSPPVIAAGKGFSGNNLADLGRAFLRLTGGRHLGASDDGTLPACRRHSVAACALSRGRACH